MIYKVATALAFLTGANALVVGGARHGGRAVVSSRAADLLMAETLPLTKVVATVGPASEDEETLAKCVAAGFSVMRCNFSHATPDEFFLRVGNLRKADGGERCALMLDTKGPEIRMGGLRVCKETGKVCFNQTQVDLHRRRVPEAETFDEKTIGDLAPAAKAKAEESAGVAMETVLA